MTAQIDVTENGAKAELRKGAQVKCKRSAAMRSYNPFSSSRYQLSYPMRVLQAGSKLRVARESSYVEVVAPIASPGHASTLEYYMYPQLLGKLYPQAWSMPCLALDRLPILVRAKPKELNYLVTHAYFMFLQREHMLTDTSMAMGDGIHSSARLNFKDPLFTIFRSFSGAQGPKSQNFGLRDTKRGVISIIIIGSRLRSDL